METYPISIAIFDFVPVTLFLVGAYFLVRIAMLQRGSRCGRSVRRVKLQGELMSTLSERKARWHDKMVAKVLAKVAPFLHFTCYLL